MPYSGPGDATLPDYIKKLKKSLREVWVKAFNYALKRFKDEGRAFKYANGVIKKIRGSKMENGFELHAEFEQPRVLTKKDVESYGLDPSLLKKPNFKVFEGDLCLINTEFIPQTEGMDGYKKFFITEDSVKKALPGLSSTPIHITGTDFTGHSVVDPKTGEEKFISIGTYLGGKIIKDGDDRICRVLGGLWEENYPKEAKAISENKDELGQSFEIRPDLKSLEEIDKETATIHDFAFKGGAILKKNLAAFPQTQLLVAQKAEDKNPKIQIVSDGTIGGTKFLLNGKEMANLRSFSISAYDGDKNLSCSFTIKEEGVDGFVKEERYYLDKDEIKIESVDGKSKEKYNCECIECGHKEVSAKHCRDIKCSECGGQMRRAERPGPGQKANKGGEEDMDNEGLEMWFPEISAVRWTRKFINDLPNGAFAVIEPDYLSGKTENKNARHLPYKGADGKIDLPHLRNALARMNQIEPITDSISTEELRARAKRKLTRLAKQYLPDSKWAKEGGVKGMDGEKIYSQVELDKALVDQKEKFENGQLLAEKEDKIVALDATVKKLEEKIAADAKAFKEKEEATAKAAKEKEEADAKAAKEKEEATAKAAKEKEEATAKEKQATVAAEKWWDENKDSYPEGKKDELIAIRKKIELGEVKKEEIEALIKEKKAGVDALLNLNEDQTKATDEQLDTLFDIKDASKVKVK